MAEAAAMTSLGVKCPAAWLQHAAGLYCTHNRHLTSIRSEGGGGFGLMSAKLAVDRQRNLYTAHGVMFLRSE